MLLSIPIDTLLSNTNRLFSAHCVRLPSLVFLHLFVGPTCFAGLVDAVRLPLQQLPVSKQYFTREALH
jgi:hypothetical protein